MNSILSIGGGRLHLVTSALHLAKADVNVRLVMGWVPQKSNGVLVRLASHVMHRNLEKSMRARMMTGKVHNLSVCSQGIVDFIENAGRYALSVVHAPFKIWDNWKWLSWKMIGFCSRRYISKDYQIFHVRSGAGQGGAIKKARQLGLKVIVDHSIAHPAFMDRELRNEYQKNGATFELGKDSKFWRQIVKDCEDADAVMVNSFFVRDTFLEQGFDEKKVKVVYLGQREDFFGLRQRRFDVSGLKFDVGEGSNSISKPQTSNLKPQTLIPSPQTSNLKLLFTGGFGFRKGGEYILEALKILKQRGVAFEMDVVGDYSSARQLIARYESDFDISYASDLKPQTSNLRLTFHGPKPQDELKSFLANGDIYVFPSLAEGCAQSGMEAMAAGMCVIGTHESGFPITDGEDGYIVPCKAAKAIADKIEWLNGHREEIDRIGANAAKLIRENYTWEKYAENVKKIYEELLKK